MRPGTILTLDADLRVIDRRPVFPWPAPSAYPKRLPEGKYQVFRPLPYSFFPLNSRLEKLHEIA